MKDILILFHLFFFQCIHLAYCDRLCFLLHRIIIHGNGAHSTELFLIIYFVQSIHATCVFLALVGYDTIFIQCTMLLGFRFETLGELVVLLGDCTKVASSLQRKILVEMYRMHQNTLE